MIKLLDYMMLDSIESILISSAQLRYKPIEVESSLFRHQHSPELMDSNRRTLHFEATNEANPQRTKGGPSVMLLQWLQNKKCEVLWPLGPQADTRRPDVVAAQWGAVPRDCRGRGPCVVFS